MLPAQACTPSSYLAAADGALLVIVRCPASAVCPVLPLKEAGVGVLLQLLQIPGLDTLGELGLPQGFPWGQARPSCMALVGDVHLERGNRVGTAWGASSHTQCPDALHGQDWWRKHP